MSDTSFDINQHLMRMGGSFAGGQGGGHSEGYMLFGIIPIPSLGFNPMLNFGSSPFAFLSNPTPLIGNRNKAKWLSDLLSRLGMQRMAFLNGAQLSSIHQLGPMDTGHVDVRPPSTPEMGGGGGHSMG